MRPKSNYRRKFSIRGGLVKTNDGQAVFVAIIGMLFFLAFSVLSVINNNSKTEDEENNGKSEEFKEFTIKTFK